MNISDTVPLPAIPKPSLLDHVVEIALDEVRRGVFEKSNNNNQGERIDEYQMKANGVIGEKWCAKFVYWCFEQAAAKLLTKNPMPKIFGSAQLETWALREKKLTSSPAKGDILILEHRHVGIVSGPATATGQFPSIEGNTWAGTNFQNRREGVYALKKQKVAKCTFVRLA